MQVFSVLWELNKTIPIDWQKTLFIEYGSELGDKVRTRIKRCLRRVLLVPAKWMEKWSQHKCVHYVFPVRMKPVCSGWVQKAIWAFCTGNAVFWWFQMVWEVMFLCWFFSGFLIRKKKLWFTGKISFLFLHGWGGGRIKEEKSWPVYKQRVEGKFMGAQKRGSRNFQQICSKSFKDDNIVC